MSDEAASQAGTPEATPSPGHHASPRIGSWEWDRSSGRVSWSAALERLHGLEPGTFGGTFEDFNADIHPDDRDRVLEQIEATTKAAGVPYRISYRIVLPDGALRWVEAYGEPVLDGQGAVIGMRGVCMDVSTERNLARQRDAVYAANHALAAANDLEEGLQSLTHIVCEAFDCAFVEYRDSGDGGRTLQARVGWPQVDGSDRLADFAQQIEAGSDEGPAARAWSTGSPVWIDDLEAQPPSPRRATALAVGLRGGFAVPVTSAGTVIGVLCAFTDVPLQDAGLPPTLDALAAEVSQFIRRLRAEEELRARERQQSTVAELGRLALAGPPLQELLDGAVWMVAETLEVEYAKVLQLLPDGEALRLISGVGWQDGLVGSATVGTERASQAGYTLSVDGPVVVRDLREETRFSGPSLLHDHGVVSGLSTVIRAHDGTWGVLGAHTSRLRVFSEDDTLFLEGVANILASALDRDGRERAQDFVLRANELLFESLDLHERLKHLAALAVEEVADWCVVYLLDEHGERQPLEVAHRDPAKVRLVEQYRQRLAGRGSGRPNIVDIAISTGETQLVPRITLDDVRNADLSTDAIELLEVLQLQALAVAPLRTRERTLGAILLVSAESGYRYGQTERHMVDELARRAAIAIDNAQLYEQTREALRTREDFVSIASHELRSPLTSVVGYSARLRRLASQDRLDSSAHEGLDVIHAEAERMQQTLELFLDVAGLDTGRFAADIEPTDLVELVQQASETLLRGHSALDLEVQLPREEVCVETDPSRIRTIVSNLLNNAVKYGGEPPHVTVTVEQGAGTASIRVRDNGSGIAQGDRERIFERFYRGQDAESRGRRGLGLGLYISKQIADRLGAKLWFESTEGAGTEFVLELPRESAARG